MWQSFSFSVWDENFPGTLSWTPAVCDWKLSALNWRQLSAVSLHLPCKVLQDGPSLWFTDPTAHWQKSHHLNKKAKRLLDSSARRKQCLFEEVYSSECVYSSQLTVPLQLLWPTNNADAQGRWAAPAGRPCQSAWCCQLTPSAGKSQYSAFPYFLILFWPFIPFCHS